MDIAETTIAPESIVAFREARLKHYHTFVVQEALVGTHICIETLDAITQREITAGRMEPNDNIRRIADEGMAEPHLSREELIRMTANQSVESNLTVNEQTPNLWRRAIAMFRGHK